MKRNPKYIPTWLALLSLAMLLAVVGLWAASSLQNIFWNGIGANGDWLYLMVQGPSTGTQWTGGGGFWDVVDVKQDMNNIIMGGRAWFLILLFSFLPVLWLNQYRKRRKLSPSACPGCGYDLTDDESGVCPECGEAKESTSDPA
jgi:hypothetical protein